MTQYLFIHTTEFQGVIKMSRGECRTYRRRQIAVHAKTCALGIADAALQPYLWLWAAFHAS